MTPRPLAPGLCFVLGLGLGAAACESGPSKHELYMQGMQVEGEASRSECQPAFDAGMDTHVLDGDVVQACLRRTEEAIALYERAKSKGLEDLDFVQTYEKALERKKHLESMLRVVRELERPDEVYPGAPPEATQVRE